MEKLQELIAYKWKDNCIRCRCVNNCLTISCTLIRSYEGQWCETNGSILQICKHVYITTIIFFQTLDVFKSRVRVMRLYISTEQKLILISGNEIFFMLTPPTREGVSGLLIDCLPVIFCFLEYI